MFCPNCGKEVKDATSKFCSECGFSFKDNTVKHTEAHQAYIPYESVQKKQETDMVRLFSRLAAGFAGYGTIHAVVSLFLWGDFTGTGFKIVLLMLVLALGCFIASKSFNKTAPFTEHFKFKCIHCGEENIVSADIDTTFECKKCQKKFVIVENNIKTID